MFVYHLPGDLTLTAKYLMARSPIADERLAIGAAVALFSSLAADRFWIQPPSISPQSDHSVPRQFVTQGVGLVGRPGSGKGSMICGVEQLAHLIGIDDRLVKYRRTVESVFLLASAHQGVLWIEDNSIHHALADFQADSEARHDIPRIPNLLAHLHLHGEPLDVVERPFCTRRADVPAYVRATRFTFLTESTPNALLQSLPRYYEWSPFFGSLLWVRANERRVRNLAMQVTPPADLLSRLTRLAVRKANDAVQVGFTTEAFELVRFLFVRGADRKSVV